MLEHVSTFQRDDHQILETVVDGSDGHPFHISHGVLHQGQVMPHHKTDSAVHVIIVRGTLALRVADQMIHAYEAGTIVFVPCGVVMELRNASPEILEFFTVQAAFATVRAFTAV